VVFGLLLVAVLLDTLGMVALQQIHPQHLVHTLGQAEQGAVGVVVVQCEAQLELEVEAVSEY
jgi:hypothetical protein